jgi:hypothetical protein
MSDFDDKHERIHERRREWIIEWAAYVRSAPDEEWGEQVNRLVDAQLESARHHEDDRPEPEDLHDSALLDEG